MNKASKIRIDALIAANISPQRLKGSEGIALKSGRSVVKLVDDEGTSTTAGKYWSIKSGQALPEGVYAADRHPRWERGIHTAERWL